jgi:hypothetical protein
LPPTALSQALIAVTVEFDNEFERVEVSLRSEERATACKIH